MSNYWYDAAGERTVKTSGESQEMYVNSVFSGGDTQTANFTAYVNPYLVVSKGGQYTKHIYIGSQRIVSKLGDLDSYGPDPRRIEYAGANVDGAKVDYANKYKALQQTIKDRYTAFEVPYYGKDNDDYVNGQGFCCDDTPKLKSFNPSQNDNPELYQYYYHSDHLGSSSLITNLDGETVQHIEYVPFGEVFIEERNNKWNTPFLFNSKELDEETGLYYYGARYYDPRTSVWLSTDPLREKYPNITSYAYCALNPVKFIDPDGKDIILPKGISIENIYIILGNVQKLTNDKLVYSTQNDGTIRIKIASLAKSGTEDKVAGTNLIRKLNSSSKTTTIEIGSAGSGNSAAPDSRTTSGKTDWTKSTNGKGDNATVSFDITSNPSIKTVDPKTGNVSGATRPNQVGLAHELIHADHITSGDVDFTSTNHTYKTASGNVTQTQPNEELRTVGVKGTKKGDITENQIRKEQKQNSRGGY